jgi:hypothetical protein
MRALTWDALDQMYHRLAYRDDLWTSCMKDKPTSKYTRWIPIALRRHCQSTGMADVASVGVDKMMRLTVN